MTLSSSSNQRFIKSWIGLGLGLLFIGLNIASFIESRELHSVFGALAFLSFTYPWSQLTSFKAPSPMNRVATVMTCVALALLAISLLLRFF